MTHRHRTARQVEAPYSYCLRPACCVASAHGGIRRVEECDCGAIRKTNICGKHIETSGWYQLLPQKDIDYD